MRRSCRSCLLLATLLVGVVRLPAQLTEVPHTVAPGRFLLEVDALSLALDREAGGRYTAFGAGTVFLTTGVTDRLDVQAGAELFLSQKYEEGGFTDRTSGVGDVYGRVKWKFYEHGGTAVALLPYVKLPTNTGGVGNDAVEGGVILPISLSLPTGLEIALMVEWDLVRNPADDGYDSLWAASAYVHHALTDRWGLYAEAGMAKSSGGEPWQGTLGAGATLAISEHLSWDYAVYRGISRGAADWAHVLRLNVGF